MLLPLLMAQKSGAHQLRLGSIYPIIYKEFDIPVGFQQSNSINLNKLKSFKICSQSRFFIPKKKPLGAFPTKSLKSNEISRRHLSQIVLFTKLDHFPNDTIIFKKKNI